MASFVSIGATGKVTHRKSKSKIPGLVGHLLASARLAWHPRRNIRDRALRRARTTRAPTFDHKVLNLKVFDCIVNKTNHFGYSWVIAPKAKIDDGYLDVTLFDIRAYNYLLNFPLIYLGHYQKILKHFKARRVIIRGDILHAQYNGEILEPCGRARAEGPAQGPSRHPPSLSAGGGTAPVRIRREAEPARRSTAADSGPGDPGRDLEVRRERPNGP